MRNRLLFFGALVVSLVGISASALIIVCPGGSNGDTVSQDPNLPVLPPSFGGYRWLDPYTRAQLRLAFSPSSESGIVPVYRVVLPPFDDAYARSIAKKFGMQGEPQRTEIPEYLAGKCPGDYRCGTFVSYALETEDAGLDIRPMAFFYSSKALSAVTPRAFSDEEAGSIAKSYLSQHELLPETAEVMEVTRQENHEGAAVELGDSRLNEYLRTSTIRLGLDGDGSVESVSYAWRNLTIVGRYPIISEAQAYDRILKGTSSMLLGPNMESQSANLSSVELRCDLASEEQGYLGIPIGTLYYVPYYYFSSTDGDSIRVPALPNQYIFPPGFKIPPEG